MLNLIITLSNINLFLVIAAPPLVRLRFRLSFASRLLRWLVVTSPFVASPSPCVVRRHLSPPSLVDCCRFHRHRRVNVYPPLLPSPSCRRHRAAAKLPPPPRGARGDDGNSLEGRKGGAGVSRAVRGSKRARFFSSGIDLPPAARVRRRRIGYWGIARAGSYKGCIRAPLDSRPLRRYDAASGRAEILELILETAL